jgi:hypothetical protein
MRDSEKCHNPYPQHRLEWYSIINNKKSAGLNDIKGPEKYNNTDVKYVYVETFYCCQTALNTYCCNVLIFEKSATSDALKQQNYMKIAGSLHEELSLYMRYMTGAWK